MEDLIVPERGSAKASDSMLPCKVVVPISTVNRVCPEVTREASTGRNLTAVANAKATRSVIHPNSDGSKKVAKSKTVPGFEPVPAENLGQNAFVGTVTQGGETHIGLRATQRADRGSNPGRVRSEAGRTQPNSSP